MNATTIFRVISLIPDRMPRAQSGCVFALGGQPERVALLAKFLHWLGPLDPVSKEDQRLLGVRSGGGRPIASGEEAEEEIGEETDEESDLNDVEDREEISVKQPGAGTRIAA
jgi:hypothetical protein